MLINVVKQPVRPVSVLERRGIIVPGEEPQHRKTIRMVFQSIGSRGLKMGRPSYKTPSALVLRNEGLIGFAAKTTTRRMSEGRPWVESSRPILKKTKNGYENAIIC